MKGEVLAKNPSNSHPGKFYEIIRGHDGVTYCDCWQWKTHKDCSHLKDFLAGQTTYKVRKQKVDGKMTTYLDLEQAIARAVQELS